jgi:HEAT repeat protein
MNRSRAWTALVDGLRHGDPLARCDAARLLGALGDRRAVPALCRVLASDAHLTKITAIYALGEIDDRQAAPMLRRIAADPGVFRFPGMPYHDLIRLAAAIQLARWNDASGASAVNDLLRLRELPLLDLGPLIATAPATRPMARFAQHPSLQSLLAHRWTDANASGTFSLVRYLAHVPGPRSRDIIRRQLRHFSRYVRVAAAEALLHHDRDALPTVRAAARRETSGFGRIRLGSILHAHGSGDATGILSDGMVDRDPFLRATAIDAITTLHLPELADAVARCTSDADWLVRSRTAAALAVLFPDHIHPALASLGRDPEPRVVLEASASFLRHPRARSSRCLSHRAATN